MGAPAVIAAPSKSYVAINSYRSDRSLPPTLCDLGRVSNIAAAVTLPRTSNFVTRNNVAQSIRSLPHNKRPISEVLDCSNSNSHTESAPSASSTTHATAYHKKRRYTPVNHSSSSGLVTPSTLKTDLDRTHDSNPQSKEMKVKSMETSSVVYSPNLSAAIIQKINSVSLTKNTQRKPNTKVRTSKSTNSSPQILFPQPVQIRLQETKATAHLEINQNVRSYTPHTTQLPSQQTMQLPAPGMEQRPTHHSLPVGMQLQQQNQQLRNENVQLQKQLSLFRQLIKNPQRLNQVITRLEQRAQ